jgi:hypothetical protein
MQIAQDISLRMYVKKRRRSGLRRGFLACIIREIAKSRCVSYFSTVPNKSGAYLKQLILEDKARRLGETGADMEKRH